MRRLSPSAVAPLAALLVVAGVAGALASRQPDKTEKQSSERLATSAAGDRNKRCASQRTYAAIQQELFRQAAETRGSDEAAFGQISTYSIVRMEQPIVRSFDQELGTVRCAGKLILQLPRGIAVVGGRHALAADVDYVLQPAADGSGDVVMLEGEAPITIPLATLARSGSHAELAAAPVAAESPTPGAVATQGPLAVAIPPVRTQVAMRPVPPSSSPSPSASVTKTATAQPPAQGAKPSFNCRYARTRGEVSVCGDAGLASLDRRMAGDYYRAVASASARQRDALRSSRNAFLRKRDRCTTQACMSASYHERMNEIGQIMTD